MNILWDFDGTLFDTYPAYTRIVKDVLGDTATYEEVYARLKVSFPHAIQHYGEPACFKTTRRGRIFT